LELLLVCLEPCLNGFKRTSTYKLENLASQNSS